MPQVSASPFSTSSREGLRLLYLAHFVPYPPDSGTRWAIHANLSYLAPRHQVRLVCRDDAEASADAVRGLQQLGCREVIPCDRDHLGDWAPRSYLTGGSLRACLTSPALQRLLPPLCEWAEIIQAEHPEMALNLLSVLQALRPEQRPPVVLRLHDVMSVFLAERAMYGRPSTGLVRRVCPPAIRSAFLRRRAAQYRRLERGICESVDAVVVFSREDEDTVRRLAPRAHVVHIPLGTDPQLPATPGRHPSDGGTRTLTFVGKMAWHPNADAAMHLVRDIMPRLSDLDLRVLIIGKYPAPELQSFDDGERVRVLGYVPDLQAVWQTTAVAVVPVSYGTGVKMKTLDAMAHGIPVVAYPAGSRGVAAIPGVDFLEARTPAEFAQHVRRLLVDPGLFRRIAGNGRRAVAERHSPSIAGGRLEALYAELLARKDDDLLRGITDRRSAGPRSRPAFS